MWNIRFLVLTMLMTLKKPGRPDIQPTDLQRGVENGPFLGRKASKKVYFWIFLAKGPRWEDRATRRALEKVYFKQSYRITQAVIKIPLSAALALYYPRESWKKLSFFSRYYVNIIYFLYYIIFKQNSNLRGGIFTLPDERTPPWSNNTAIYLMTSDVTLQWPHNVTSVT